MQMFTEGGFAQRPQAASAFAQAMEEFLLCEVEVATLTQVLLPDDPDRGLKQLNDDKTFSARIRVARARAEALSSTDRALVEAALVRAESAAKQRNKIAHSRWGYSTVLPHEVIRFPTKNAHLEIHARLTERMGGTANHKSAEDGAEVYVVQDFLDIHTAATNAHAALSLTINSLMNSEPAKSQLRATALSDPVTEQQFNKAVKRFDEEPTGWRASLVGLRASIRSWTR